MKMGVFLRRGARREEGMALLFALGFLALMLILGLGFVTTSLLSQKIAANNSSRAQARMFARSAMARAMLNVMLYNDQAVLKGKTVESYDWICSYDKADYNDGPGDGTDNVVSSGELSDQLHKSGDAATDGSKFKYQPGTEESYTGEDSKAKWLFFYDAPEGIEGRRIIGRAAYQVLPREAAGRLSLYAVTGGSKVRNDYRFISADMLTKLFPFIFQKSVFQTRFHMTIMPFIINMFCFFYHSVLLHNSFRADIFFKTTCCNSVHTVLCKCKFQNLTKSLRGISIPPEFRISEVSKMNYFPYRCIIYYCIPYASNLFMSVF